MQIPEIFFGTKRDVRDKLNTVVNRLKRAPLADQISGFELINSKNFPGIKIYPWPSIVENKGQGFWISELNYLLQKENVLCDSLYKFRLENTAFLKTTVWGCMIINSPQAYYWVLNPGSDISFERSTCIDVLESIVINFDDFVNANSEIEYTYASFPEVPLLYKYVVANTDIDRIETSQYNWQNSKIICQNLIIKLTDESYWEKCMKVFIEKNKIKYKTDKKISKIQINNEIEWYRNEINVLTRT